ncbi:MAG: cyclic nucleotide-binding domain-containing protein [Leptospirales bacterium]|nr:cyclic nucleotide-binding domain-containing protein [Leptospirales bacterium]
MNEERQVKAGDIIFTQTTPPNEITILQSGIVEFLSAPDDYDGIDPQIILRHSSRVMLMKEPGIIVGHSLLLTGICSKSVRAVSNCSLVSYPLNSAGFEEIAARDPNSTAVILRQIFNRINNAAVNDQKYSKLYQNICVISDNLSLMYTELAGSGAPAGLETKASSLHQNFLSSQAAFPQQFTAQFIITDHGRFLSRRYGIPGETVESIIQKDIIGLTKRLLSMDKQVFAEMIKADRGIAVTMCETLTGIYDGIVSRIESANAIIGKELNSIFGPENSWSDYLANNDGFEQWKNSNKLSDDFIKNFLSFIIKLNSIYEELIGEKLTTGYPGIKLIHDYYTSADNKSKEEDTKPSSAGAEIQLKDTSIADLKNSMGTIFNFALVDKDFQTRFLKLLNDFKTSKTPFSTDSDMRRTRTQIAKLYWDLYKQAYIRSRAERNIPKPVRLMLAFGFLDETFLEQEQLIELNHLITIKEPKPALPILRESEFLSLLHEEKELPSITEMGLSYDAFLREQAKHSRIKKRSDDEEEDVIDEKTKIVMYEVDRRTTETAAVCSGSRATSFPILTSQVIKGKLTDLVCTKSKVETAVRNVMSVDFSLFYRETILKIKENVREIIQEEVTPYVILLPIFGTNTLLWQEMSGTNKKSRARITVPIFFMGDLERSIAHTLACYRWELSRSIKGAMWADPLEGGVTGEYFDYVNTYKKNSKLSLETKEKLAERFKSLRTNRDRFADDYLLWIYYERNGIMKLNTVVREMFYKHIPMSKEIREQLSNMPVFTHAATRYKNIQKRNIEHYERKFKKYQDSNGRYPPEIEKYVEYLKS